MMEKGGLSLKGCQHSRYGMRGLGTGGRTRSRTCMRMSFMSQLEAAWSRQIVQFCRIGTARMQTFQQ